MIAAPRLTIAEPIQGGTLLLSFAMARPAARPRSRRNRRLPGHDSFAVSDPAWPWQREPELALLLAFIDIVEAHAGDSETMTALYASELRRLEAREQGLQPPQLGGWRPASRAG